MRGITSVLWRLLSTVGDSFSTVEVVLFSGGLHQCMQGNNISAVGNTSVLWRDGFSTVGGGNSSTCGGIASVLWGYL